MGLADRVAGRVTELQRADPVTLEEFGYLLGQTSGTTGHTRSGVSVGVNRALAIPAWYSGCLYLSTSVAFLPWATYRKPPMGPRVRRTDPPWMRKPDAETPWPALLEHWVMSLLHRGNAYGFKLRNNVGQVVGLRPLHPDRVKPGRASDGTKVFQVDNREDIGFTSREILHIPGLSYDGVMGLDPIRIHAEALGLIAAADEFAARSFGQGTHMQAYISLPQPLSPEQADELKVQWSKFHRGIQNAHEFGVLGNGAEYKTISLDPQQTQLLETRKYGVLDVARLLRMPPHKLYELDRATFSNIEHQAIESVTDGVKPIVERIETWLSFDPDLTPALNFTEADLDGLLRGDIKTRFEAKGIAVDKGALSPNEWREDEGWDRIAGLDYFLVPLNMRMVGPDAIDDSAGEASPRTIAETIQKIYLGVPDVLSAEEARRIVDRLGAGLDTILPAGLEGAPT
jgi:HK97 family phage portal protein